MENNKVIEDGNKTIGLFMGGKLDRFNLTHKEHLKKLPHGRTVLIEDLKYHSSWDWLMPAIKKFDTMFEEKYFRPKLPKWYSIYEHFCDSIDHKVTLYEILPVWESFVEAIKWYNSKFVNSQKPLNGKR